MVRVEILILVKTSESIMDFKAINKYLVIIIIIIIIKCDTNIISTNII